MKKWKNEETKNRWDEKNDGIEKCKRREGRKVRSEYSELKSWSNKYEEIRNCLIYLHTLDVPITISFPTGSGGSAYVLKSQNRAFFSVVVNMKVNNDMMVYWRMDVRVTCTSICIKKVLIAWYTNSIISILFSISFSILFAILFSILFSIWFSILFSISFQSDFMYDV